MQEKMGLYAHQNQLEFFVAFHAHFLKFVTPQMLSLQLYPDVNQLGTTDYKVNIHINTSTSGNKAVIEKVYLVGKTIFALGKITRYGMAEALAECDVSVTIKLPPHAHITAVRKFFIGGNLMPSSNLTILKNEEEFLRIVQKAGQV